MITLCIIIIPAIAASFQLDVREHVLENGLKVLLLEDHKAPTATFQIWYRVGSVNENIGRTGISHLLEHMMFKGTSKHGPKTFSQAIKRVGGIDNAFTSKEYTGYFQLLSSDMIEIPLELEADRMQNLLLSPDAVRSESDVVMEERRLRYEDDPQGLLHEELISTAFKNHPYRWPVIGWMSDLKDVGPDELREYYTTYYTPNNAVIVVVGDINAADLLKAIDRNFGSIPKGPEVPLLKIKEPDQLGEKRIYVKREAELPYIIDAYKVPNVHHEDTFALEVLGSILSEGKSSRLYSTLVYEKQVALSAWGSYSNFNKDPFLFFFGATAAQGIKIEEVELALNDIIDGIIKENPSGQEIQKAKNQIESSFILEQDSIYMQAKTIATFEMIGGWRFIESYLEGIRAVTPQDVSRVAKKYLVRDHRTTGVLIPLKDGEK